MSVNLILPFFVVAPVTKSYLLATPTAPSSVQYQTSHGSEPVAGIHLLI